MQITGSYSNYLTMTNLLAPMGVKGSGDLVMQVFVSAVGNLQDKIDAQIFTKDSQAALNQIYSDVSDLTAKAKKLTLDDYNSVFNDRTASSSNAGVLTATAINAFSANSGATEATYDISVAQIAQAQENKGLALDKDTSSVVDVGTDTFNVNIEGQDHELSVTVAEGDTNEEALQKIAFSINESNIGVSAKVIDGSEEGTRKLTLTSNNTGAGNSFTISDISGTAIAKTGAANVSSTARNAEYSVNGIGNTSTSNTIYLDEGMVTANLKGEGESILKISPDEDNVKNAITDLVSELNSFIDNLGKNSNYIKDEVLSSVNSFIKDNKTGLESIGITQGENGNLEIDDDQLSEAADQDKDNIKNLFGGLDGLAVQVNSYASGISTDSPLNYAKEAENISKEFADYIYGASAGMLQQALTGSLLNTFA
ncbi:MAG TPA: flagellar filament capping protein FliD [Anaerolineae bacterium]|nr:flagellar filament capping protein FliD [Anaerolineae bacterium]